MTKEPKPTIIRQTCGTCHRYVKVSSRYPNYVCDKCTSLTTDKKGKKVEFHNTGSSGHGCIGRYKHNGKNYPLNTCYIKDTRCKAKESYFGGIVITSSS